MTDPKSYHVVFWQNENTFQTPIISSKKLQLVGVQSATLNWRFTPADASFIAILFNGSAISSKTSGSADVTQYVIANGENKVAVDALLGGWAIVGASPSFGATVTLDVVASSAGQLAPTETYDFSNLPWWAWVLIGLVVLVVIYLILKKLGIIGDATKAVQAVAKVIPAAAVLA